LPIQSSIHLIRAMHFESTWFLTFAKQRVRVPVVMRGAKL